MTDQTLTVRDLTPEHRGATVTLHSRVTPPVAVTGRFDAVTARGDRIALMVGGERRLFPVTPTTPVVVSLPDPATHDAVHHPVHYNADRFGIECIAFTRLMTNLAGNAWKYLWRHAEKNGAQDLEKAIVYLRWAREDRIPLAYSDAALTEVLTLFDRHVRPALSFEDPVYKALERMTDYHWDAAVRITETKLAELRRG